VKWQTSSVRRILRSQVYTGIWHFNKHLSCEPRRQSQDRRYRKTPRSSNRLRPKTEWVAVPLPEHLRIIEPDVWRRVQEQLDRNITFSQRNAKHDYLLVGLLRCGGCKGAYVGDPAHGRFAYRCAKRCRAYGVIRESDLNTTVWKAVCKALQNPALLADAMTAINRHSSTTGQESLDSVELRRSLERIQAEETRLLQAYRLEIISAEQLAQEFEALRNRKKLIESSQSDLHQRSAANVRLIRHSVEQVLQ
jgi:site-specific DNA recombinase